MLAMSNTHILVQDFDYLEPVSIAETTRLLAEFGNTLKLLAGGTDLLVQLKMERRAPLYIGNILKVPELRRISWVGGLRIGATATIRTVERCPSVRQHYAALFEGCRSFSTTQVMFMGTIGGNICNASPAADTVPGLMVSDARLVLASSSATREVRIDEFFVGPGTTVLRPEEMLTEILLPLPQPQNGSAFFKIGRVEADISKVCVAASVVRDGDNVRDCRIALGSVAPVPFRARQAEVALRGGPFGLKAVCHAANVAAEEIRPITDARSTREYRTEVARVLVRDALNTAWQRTSA